MSEEKSKGQDSKRYFIFALIGAGVGILIFLLTLFLAPVLDEVEEGSGVVLNPSVVIYEEGISPFQIISSDNYSVTVSTMEGIEYTSVLAAGITPATPYGLLRTVASVEEVSEGYKIYTNPAALTEAIEECDISFTIIFTEDGDYEVIYGDSEAGLPFGIPTAFASAPPNNLVSYSSPFGNFSAGVMIQGHVRISLALYVDIELVLRCYAGADIALTSLEWEQTLKRIQKPMTISLGGFPFVLVNHMEINASVEAGLSSADVTFSTALDRSVGFSYTSTNGLTLINRCNSHAPEAYFEVNNDTFSAYSDMSIGVVFGSRIYGLAGPDITTALRCEMSAELNKITDDVDTQGAIQVRGLDWYLAGRYSAKVTLPIRGNFIFEIPNFLNPFTTDPIVLADIELFNTGDLITLLELNREFAPQLVSADDGTPSNREDFFTDVWSSEVYLEHLGETVEVTWEMNSDGQGTVSYIHPAVQGGGGSVTFRIGEWLNEELFFEVQAGTCHYFELIYESSTGAGFYMYSTPLPPYFSRGRACGTLWDGHNIFQWVRRDTD